MEPKHVAVTSACLEDYMFRGSRPILADLLVVVWDVGVPRADSAKGP